MSLINKEVADFSVQAYHEKKFKTFTKKDILGKWSLFFFYPADFTFVCPTELEDLVNIYDQFQAAKCEIYSVSCDTHFIHKAWHDVSKSINRITFPMLADPTGALARDFDVLIEETGLAERGSFIINPEGKIVAYEVNAGNVGRNADELLRRVQASQHVAQNNGEVCPAKWKPGS
ncbi:MAG: peroxiredoxin, partial [Treponema sp.]|nr:peroxiredoxin [Treponema sp.]